MVCATSNTSVTNRGGRPLTAHRAHSRAQPCATDPPMLASAILLPALAHRTAHSQDHVTFYLSAAAAGLNFRDRPHPKQYEGTVYLRQDGYMRRSVVKGLSRIFDLSTVPTALLTALRLIENQ
eukprot:SAG25_NODE_799_length_5273_cov_2.630847_1_plen_123_part_00